MPANILFVHNHLAPFVAIDLELLRTDWTVREWHQRSRWIELAALRRAVADCDLLFGWFASWHTFWPVSLARILRKPSILVVGGYDLANLPAMGYGHQRGGAKRWVSRQTMDLATQLVTFSQFSQAEAQRHAGIPAGRVPVIYLGVPDPYGALSPTRRDPVVLTVGNVDHANLQRKGHQAFVQAAAHLPGVEFVLAGAWRDASIRELQDRAPANVTFTGRVHPDALLDLYRRAAVYVQASTHEGFGLSVAEAMLAGCIPVVTRSGALPEVAGDAGIYLESASPDEIARCVRIGLGATAAHRAAARTRILTNFPLERRRAGLFSLVRGLIDVAA